MLNTNISSIDLLSLSLSVMLEPTNSEYNSSVVRGGL
jgi:hypothetical protein